MKSKNIIKDFMLMLFAFLFLFSPFIGIIAYAIYEFLIYLGLTEIFSSLIVTVLICISLGAYTMYSVIYDKENGFLEKEKRELEHNKLVAEDYIRQLETNANNISNNVVALTNTKNKLTADIDNIKNNTEQYLTKLTEENTISYPWLSELYADIKYIEENEVANYLKKKKRPALSASNTVKQLAKEKKIITTQLKMSQNQLRYYETVFPWLEDFKEVDPIEAYKTINDLYSNDEYSRVKSYLSPEEYNKLTNAEKYQLALERYINKTNKTTWQIGIDYERYIGYLYEKQRI